MANLDDVINAALDEVEGGEVEAPAPEYDVDEVHAEAGVEAEETPAPAEGDDTPAPVEGDETPEVVEEEVVKEKPAPAAKKVDPEIAKLLKEQGLEAPKPGQRENKLPYSRVHKITENAIKRTTDKYTGELKKRDDELATIRPEVENYRRADALAAKDPDKYIAALAQHDQRYQKFVQNAEAVAKASAVPAVTDIVAPENDPMPKKDMKFADGSEGYTEEGFQKLLEWNQRAGARQALKSVEARFGPLEKAHKATTAAEAAQAKQAEQVQAIRNTTNLLRKHFGDIFTADEKLANEGKSEIIAYQRTNRCTLLEAGLAVLLPKLAADRARIRKELIAESATRKKVVRPAPAQVKAVRKVDPNAPVDLNQVINDAIDAAGLE
jgi:hypothetical protein